MVGLSQGWAGTSTPKAKITRQPVAVTAELGDRVELSVSFTSTTGATCQWRLDKKPIRGAEDRVYVVGKVLPEDAGKYDVLITNAGGTTTSRTVVITVNLAPKTLPKDTVLEGDFIFRIMGERVQSDGAYVVTGGETMRDPEEPSARYTYSYTRQSATKANLVVHGRFYDEELGGYLRTEEKHTLTFTGVTEDGEIVALSKVSGVVRPPEGYRPSKLGFTGTGKFWVYSAD